MDLVESHAYNFQKEVGYDLFSQCEEIARRLGARRPAKTGAGNAGSMRRINTSLSIHAINPPYQHTLITTHPINPFYQPIISTHAIHIHYQYQPTPLTHPYHPTLPLISSLSIQAPRYLPINTPSHPLLTHPINTLHQPTPLNPIYQFLLTHPFPPPSIPPLSIQAPRCLRRTPSTSRRSWRYTNASR